MKYDDLLLLTAFTGILLCDIGDFYEYAEKILNKPVCTLDMANSDFWIEMKDKTEAKAKALIDKARADKKAGY